MASETRLRILRHVVTDGQHDLMNLAGICFLGQFFHESRTHSTPDAVWRHGDGELGCRFVKERSERTVRLCEIGPGLAERCRRCQSPGEEFRFLLLLAAHRSSLGEAQVSSPQRIDVSRVVIDDCSDCLYPLIEIR